MRPRCNDRAAPDHQAEARRCFCSGSRTECRYLVTALLSNGTTAKMSNGCQCRSADFGAVVVVVGEDSGPVGSAVASGDNIP